MGYFDPFRVLADRYIRGQVWTEGVTPCTRDVTAGARLRGASLRFRTTHGGAAYAF